MDGDILKIGAAYIRVSTERQDEYSPDSQLKKIREHAEREGAFIPDEFVFYDDGISGKSASKRGDFNRMIALAKEKSHPFEVIYVWKFSRFARNQEESMVYKNLLKKKGVSVVSVSEPIPEGHFGTLIERIIEWMDEFYLVNLGAEVRRGMTEKASRGEPTCAPPFGYIMREGKYFPDEESGKANIIREIFDLYANGEKMREIAIKIGDKGVLTRFGRRPEMRWIEYVLRNPCYIGRIRWSKDGARAVSKYDFKNENIMEVAGHHKPLITMEIWLKVQAMLDAQKLAYPKHAKQASRVEHMLRGIVRCSSCGGTLAIWGWSGRQSPVRTLQCGNYCKGSCLVSHCVRQPDIEASFIEGLEDALGAMSFNILPPKKKPSENAVNYDKLIEAEERRLARAKEAYLSEVDTLEQYAKNKEAITSKIEQLKRKQTEDTEKGIDIKAFAEKVSAVVALIKREDVAPSSKNEAIRSIVESVIYDKAEKSLSINFRAV